jgi:hypothetical protein
MRKVKVLGVTGFFSFLFSIMKWFVQGTDYGEC